MADHATALRNIIREADLEACTVKSILHSLEDELRHAIPPEQIPEIHALIDKILEEKLLENEDARLARLLHEEELQQTRTRKTRRGNPAPVKKAKTENKVSKGKRATGQGFNRPMVLSNTLSAVCGGEHMLSRPEVVKRIWVYVREHNLQDPSNKKFIRCDDKLQAVFKKKRVDCFSMNRYLSSHLGSRDEVVSSVDEFDEIGDEASSSDSSAEPVSHYQLQPLFDDDVDLKAKSNKELQEGCLDYLRNNKLFDSSNPTEIIIDENIRKALHLTQETKLALFDFVEKVRSIIDERQ